MAKEVVRIKERINDNNTDSGSVSTGLLSTIMLSRLKSKLNRMVLITEEVNKLYDYAETDIEWTVLDCRLSGLSTTKIAKHIGHSRTHVYSILDNIIERYLIIKNS